MPLLDLDALAAVVVSAPAPVLMLDACVLLDAVRAAVRADLGVAHILAAVTVIEQAAQSPPGVHLITTELAHLEWVKNRDKVRRSAEQHLNQHHKPLGLWSEVAAALGQRPLVEPATEFPLAAVTDVADRLAAAAQRLRPDTSATAAALDRLYRFTRPAHDSKVSDALHLEHFLALARRIRDRNQSLAVSFVSSDSEAYGQKGTSTLDALLDRELLAVGVTYFPKLSAAVESMQLGGKPA